MSGARWRRQGLLVGWLALGACSRGTTEREKEKAPPAVAPPATAGQAAAPAAPPSLPTRDVEELVERWRRAQNAGDFAAYEALYAPRFTGIKRVGERSQSFSRETWMADRKALFARPFTVEVSEVQVASAARMATVRFRQKWASASFRDEGQKQLVVVSEGGQLRVAREEMLDSKVSSGPARSDAPSSEEFGVTLWTPIGLLQLTSEALPEEAATERPVYVSERAAWRPLTTSELPPQVAARVGKQVRAYDASGAVCTAKIQGALAWVSVLPHFGTLQSWEGREGNPPVPPEARALELWNLSAVAGRYLALRLEPEGDCSRALFARDAELAAPRILPPGNASEAERDGALRAAKASARYVENQRTAAPPGGRDWGRLARLELFGEPNGGTGFASAEFRTELPWGCADAFSPELRVLLRRQGGGFTVVGSGGSSEPTSAVFDLEGDGVFEFLIGRQLFRAGPAGLVGVSSQEEISFDCPC